MTRQIPGSLLLVGAIAGGVGFVAVAALPAIWNVTVSPAAFIAILVALAAGILLALGLLRHRGEAKTERHRSLTPGRRIESRATEVGTAGVVPGGAAVAAGSAGLGLPAAPPEEPATAENAAADRPSAVAAESETARTPADSDANVHQLHHRETGAEHTEPVATTAQTGAYGEKVKSGTLLKGEQELAARKGSWSFVGTLPSERSHAAAGASDGGPDPAGSTIGVEPLRLAEAREGGPDDLKRIKGVGPKLEDMLHRLGVFHYDQIAAWTDSEVAWIDENLNGARGRASRDAWVVQARRLAADDEAEVSHRARKDREGS